MIIHLRTIAKDITLEGLGLHSGEPVAVTLRPGEEGIIFRYGADSWKATPENVTDTQRCTKLGSIATIEHLMSALAGLEVTDCDIDVSAPELPAAGGCAREYCESLTLAGFVDLGEKEVRDLYARVFVQEDGATIAIAAGAGRWAYRYDLGDRWPGRQEFELNGLPDGFKEEIAPARTFGLREELPHLERLGLAKGLDHSSALVLGPESYDNPARFPDEPARHKLLDAIGDIYLAGIPVRYLDVVAERTGHRLTVQAAAKLTLAVNGTTI